MAGTHTRPNMQCTIGAFIGIISIASAWIVRAPPPIPYPVGHGFHIYWDPHLTLLDLTMYGDLDIAFYATLFVLGTAIALFTPLGGIAQIVGLLGFVLSYRAYEMSTWRALFMPTVESHLSIGYALAILSATLVVTSASFATRNANGGRPARALSRVAAVCPSSLR